MTTAQLASNYAAEKTSKSPQMRSTIQSPVDYQSACKYIEEKYNSSYGAHIKCDYENLLIAHDDYGRCLAAVGYRQPDQNFFLEHYLDNSAEQTVSNLFRADIKRQQIVEIGNLVSSDSRTAFFTMQKLLNHLDISGFDYVMLTCTRQLKRRLKHLPYEIVTKATKVRVPKSQAWGQYYAQDPEVIAAKLTHYDQRFIKYSPPAGVSISFLSKHH